MRHAGHETAPVMPGLRLSGESGAAARTPRSLFGPAAARPDPEDPNNPADAGAAGPGTTGGTLPLPQCHRLPPAAGPATRPPARRH